MSRPSIRAAVPVAGPGSGHRVLRDRAGGAPRTRAGAAPGVRHRPPSPRPGRVRPATCAGPARPARRAPLQRDASPGPAAGGARARRGRRAVAVLVRRRAGVAQPHRHRLGPGRRPADCGRLPGRPIRLERSSIRSRHHEAPGGRRPGAGHDGQRRAPRVRRADRHRRRRAHGCVELRPSTRVRHPDPRLRPAGTLDRPLPARSLPPRAHRGLRSRSLGSASSAGSLTTRSASRSRSCSLAIWGLDWARTPTIWPALIVGLGTIVAPWFVMQPAMGAGIAASRTPDPRAARLRNLGTHTVYGVGLFLSAVAVSTVLPFGWAT